MFPGLPEKSEGRERVERVTGWGLGRTACNRTWLTMPSTGDADACMPVFGLEEDILSICCDCISYTYDMVRDVLWKFVDL